MATSASRKKEKCFSTPWFLGVFSGYCDFFRPKNIRMRFFPIFHAVEKYSYERVRSVISQCLYI